MNRITNTLRNLTRMFNQWRARKLFLTPREHSIAVLIAHQLNREELEGERRQYKEACHRLTQIHLEYRRSKKIVKVEIDFDEQLFVNNTPYTLTVIADTVLEKAKAKWDDKYKE